MQNFPNKYIEISFCNKKKNIDSQKQTGLEP